MTTTMRCGGLDWAVVHDEAAAEIRVAAHRDGQPVEFFRMAEGSMPVRGWWPTHRVVGYCRQRLLGRRPGMVRTYREATT